MAAWMTAAIATVSALAALANLLLTLRLRAEHLEMRQEVLNEVGKVYRREDVCKADMRALRAEFGHGANTPA